MLYIEVINHGGLPFQPSTIKFPTDETLEAFNESVEHKNLIKYKSPADLDVHPITL